MTRFASMPQRTALAILLVAFISTIGLILLAKKTPPNPTAVAGQSDNVTYFAILDLMRSGSNYYHAAHEALLARGYGTASVFNWRTPAWPVLLAHLPSVHWAQTLLAALGLTAALLAYRTVRAESNFPLALSVLLSVLTALMWLIFPLAAVFTEIAAGVLILLSVVSYGNRQPAIGLLTAMAALFIRELAAPYILLCISFAICRRSTRELVGWAFALLAYFVYFAWHWSEVAQQWGTSDRADPESWIQFGGIKFILTTAYFNGVSSIAPLWLSVALLPIALVGLFAWRQGLRAALTVTIYLCLFAVVGKPSNGYWGALYTPLLMLGLPWAIPAMYDALAPRVAKAA